MKPPGGLLVHLFQHGVKPGLAVRLCGHGFIASPNRRVALLLSQRHAVQQTFQIKARAAYQQRNFPPLPDVRKDPLRVLHVPGYGVAFLRLQNIQHVMGNLLLLRARGLGGADVHAPVDLHTVHADDLHRIFPGQLHGKAAFSRSGASRQGQNLGLHRPPSFSIALWAY